jgi:hypothetical protein
LGLDCPAAATPTPASIGYGLSLQDVTGIVASLVGVGALTELVSVADNDDWNTMALRIDDATNTLRVEVRGRPSFAQLPLQSTGADTWSWTHAADGINISGTLHRSSGGLSWAATAGTIDLGAGPQAITSTTRSFPLLPTE